MSVSVPFELSFAARGRFAIDWIGSALLSLLLSLSSSSLLLLFCVVLVLLVCEFVSVLLVSVFCSAFRFRDDIR